MTSGNCHLVEDGIPAAGRSAAGLAGRSMSREQRWRQSPVSTPPSRRISSGWVSTNRRKAGSRGRKPRVSWHRFPVEVFDSIQTLKDGGAGNGRDRPESADGAENELEVSARRFPGDCYGVTGQKSGQDPYDAEKLVHVDWQDAKESGLGDSAELTNSASHGMWRHQMGR